MILVYPVGVMSMYYYFLSANKEEIMAIKDAEIKEREEKGLVVSTMSSRRAVVVTEKSKPEPAVHLENKGQHPSMVSTRTELELSVLDDHKDEQGNGQKHGSKEGRTVSFSNVHPDSSLATPDAEEVTVDPPPKKQKIVGAAELNFLYKAYEGHVWYWEVVETARRLLLTAIISVIGQGSAEQIVFGIVISLIYIKLYGYYAPFDLDEHDVLQVCRHCLISPFTLSCSLPCCFCLIQLVTFVVLSLYSQSS